MQKSKKLTLVLFIQAALISTAYASEQSEAKGFVEDSEGSVLFRTGYLMRDKKNGLSDTSSTAQTAIFKLESGFTQGIIGFGAGVIGDASIKLGKNGNTGNQMIPTYDKLNADGSKDAYDHWARGGAFVKARVSNTTVTYGTQISEIPVIASNTARLTPEYFTGLSVISNEIENLSLFAGKFTKNQWSHEISSDEQKLDRAIYWGAKYKFNEQLNSSYYGVDVKDKLDRHYANINYAFDLKNDASLTLDTLGYYTKWDTNASTASHTTNDLSNRQNTIWAVSAAYDKDVHNIKLAYQDNAGNTGYDYAFNKDGLQSIWVPNSYLSDFIGNDEKSLGLQYSYNFKNYGLAGLSWTNAFVYGWDIDVAGPVDRSNLISNNASEREFFSQIKYTVQTGPMKDASLRLRHSYLRLSEAYDLADNNGYGSTNEWRIWLDIPVKLF